MLNKVINVLVGKHCVDPPCVQVEGKPNYFIQIYS